MKSKFKRLKLNKITVTNLNGNIMGKIKGGTDPWLSCDPAGCTITCNPHCPTYGCPPDTETCGAMCDTWPWDTSCVICPA
jgi:hypothetical protein